MGFMHTNCRSASTRVSTGSDYRYFVPNLVFSENSSQIVPILTNLTNSVPNLTNSVLNLTHSVPILTNSVPILTNSVPNLINSVPNLINSVPILTFFLMFRSHIVHE